MVTNEVKDGEYRGKRRIGRVTTKILIIIIRSFRDVLKQGYKQKERMTCFLVFRYYGFLIKE